MYTSQQIYEPQTQQHQLSAEPEAEHGTVALDESYGVEESYDYQYEAYENGGEMMDPGTGVDISGAYQADNSGEYVLL